MLETFELYVKNTSNSQGAPLASFERLSPRYTTDEVKVHFDFAGHSQKSRYSQWCLVVGWTDLYFGTACPVHICWVRNSGQVGVLVYGGNSGVRIYTDRRNPSTHQGQPWVWIDEKTAQKDLPSEVLAIIGDRPIVEAYFTRG